MNRIREIRWNVIQGWGEREGCCCCQIDVDSLAADSVLEEVEEKETEYFLSGELVVFNADVKIMMLH